MILFKNSDTTHDDMMLNSKVETPQINGDQNDYSSQGGDNNKGGLDDMTE